MQCLAAKPRYSVDPHRARTRMPSGPSTQAKQTDEPLWEPARHPDFVTAPLPEVHILLHRHRASSSPAVQRAQILDTARVSVEFAQHRRNDGLCRAGYATVILERGSILAKPSIRSGIPDLVESNFLVVLDCAATILPNGVREGSIVRKGRTLCPAVCELPQSAQRERLDEDLLQPLAWTPRLTVRPPAVGKDMPKLMTKLVGELAPIPFPDGHHDPADPAGVVMKPYRRTAGSAVFNPKPAGLLIGKQLYSRQTHLAHARYDSGRGLRRRLPPVTPHLHG